MTPTEQYINVLRHLKAGELSVLRRYLGRGLDASVEAFDLFAGLWWPLRRKYPPPPQREVAWLVAKLYTSRPIDHSSGHTIARQLARLREHPVPAKDPVARRLDRMLALPLNKIEPALRWALDLIASKHLKLDWVELTDDLRFWERESKRLKWAKEFLKTREEGNHVD